jgi:P4 family phage/plasmid primase-like protien
MKHQLSLYNFSITDSEIEALENEFGPFYYGDKDRLNESFFANLYIKYETCVFDVQKRSFYLYESETGLWRAKDMEYVKERIAFFSRNFLKQQGVNSLFSCIKNQFTRDCLEIVKGTIGKNDPFFNSKEGFKVHCQNGVLEISPDSKTWVLREFSPDDYSRNRTEIAYNPEAGTPNRFLNELLKPVLTADEIDILQMYAGQCLLGVNHSQKFLLITGPAGTGKSTLVEVIKMLVNPENATEFRAEHLSSRFEIGRYYDKTLLLGSDVSENFLNAKGIGNLKKLTGHDSMTAEYKGNNHAVNIKGDFNVIITSNSLPEIRMENDSDAWRRRLLWIQYKNNPNMRKTANFAQNLIQEEGSAILNWALEGALKLYLNNKSINIPEPLMEQIDDLLAENDTVRSFVQQCIGKVDGFCVSNTELFNKFCRFVIQHEMEPVSSRDFNRRVKSALSQILQVRPSNSVERNGKMVRGYRNIQAVVC